MRSRLRGRGPAFVTPVVTASATETIHLDRKGTREQPKGTDSPGMSPYTSYRSQDVRARFALDWRIGMIREFSQCRRPGAVGVIIAAAAVILFAAPIPASASYPNYFWYGADSFSPQATGSGPYYMPSPLSGPKFAVYVGEVGTWYDELGCASYSGRAVNATDETAANWEFNNDLGGGYPNLPEGTALYWFMGGPGADPNYYPNNYSNTEAYNWGKTQAQAAYAYWPAHGPSDNSDLFIMDMEGADSAGQYQGWNEDVYSSGPNCGYIIPGTGGILPNYDRQTFNGFWDYMNSQSFYPGIYSSQSYWTQTMGGSCGVNGNTNACIETVYQWTYEDSSPSVTPGPSGWTQGGGYCNGGADCVAGWFGHVQTDHQLMWQWSQANGDWNQSNATYFPLG